MVGCEVLSPENHHSDTMHSVLITNPEGKILLSRYFDTSFRVPPAEGSDAENAAGFATTRDRALAMRLSESEVLEQTRHLWTKGTAECPQVARAKVRLECLRDFDHTKMPPRPEPPQMRDDVMGMLADLTFYRDDMTKRCIGGDHNNEYAFLFTFIRILCIHLIGRGKDHVLITEHRGASPAQVLYSSELGTRATHVPPTNFTECATTTPPHSSRVWLYFIDNSQQLRNLLA